MAVEKVLFNACYLYLPSSSWPSAQLTRGTFYFEVNKSFPVTIFFTLYLSSGGQSGRQSNSSMHIDRREKIEEEFFSSHHLRKWQ